MIDALVQFDTVLFFLINGMHHPITDTLFIVLTQLGNGWVITPLLLFVVILKIPPQKRVKIIVCGAIGLILCGVVNSQIKRLVGRKRPAAVFSYRRPHDATVVDRKTSQIIHLVGPAYQSRSFPSGHTNTAFSAAMFLAILFGRWFYLTFLAAFLVGYSRIYLGVHFPLDVIGGALLGSGMIGAFMRIAAINDKQFLLGVVHDKR